MVPWLEVYRRAVAPALITITLLSLLSISFVLAGELPRVERLDPQAALYGSVALLAATGVIVPIAFLLIRTMRLGPRLALGAACVAAAMAHAVTLDELLRAPGQNVTSLLAVVVAGVFFFVTLLAVIERKDEASVEASKN